MTQNVEIIAELAQGFEGSEAQALSLLKAASSAGANSAKIQVIFADELCVPDYVHYDLFKGLEMDVSSWGQVAHLAKQENISLILDVFGKTSLELATEIGVDRIMLHATDLNNQQLLSMVAQSNTKDVFLGIGGGHQSEINKAIETLSSKNIILMAGFQGYPTEIEDNQIARIKFLHSQFAERFTNVSIGFADHSLPTSHSMLGICAMAVACGATYVEKHLTLASCMKLEDFEAAINPDVFLDFVVNLRHCMAALGRYKKTEDFGMSASETSYRLNMRRSVIANAKISSGTKFTIENLAFKRAPTDAATLDIGQIIGKVAACDILENEIVQNHMIKK